MEFVDGQNMKEFIKCGTVDEHNKAGICIIDFVFRNLYKHGIFYSDIHYGNFIVKADSSICVLDFGCLHKFDDDLISDLRNLHVAVRDRNTDNFFSSIQKLGIVNVKDLTKEERIYMFDYFQLQFAPWIFDGEFEFTQEWMESSMHKNIDLMTKWKLPNNIVYLNKIPFGMYHLLTKLKTKGNFREVMDKLLSPNHTC
jgi:predicted unusual protein kinase regulating ubiquinone biosynthesis (AarF/ABC1/UbiB family)